MIACVLLSASAVVACGGDGKKKSPTKPIAKNGDSKKPPPAPETEEDREKKRKAAALALVPDGSACLPAALKDATAPRLELAAVGGDALVCAVDQERERLLGLVACWKVELASGGLEYKAPAPLPSRGFAAKIDDRCARGYCVPKDAKLTDAKVAYLAWSPDTTKVAVLAGDDVHLFDAATKTHETSFTIRGDKGVGNDPIGLTWVGGAIFVEGADAKAYSAVWGFKVDGTPLGPIEAIGAPKGAKPLSTYGGSFVVLDKARVAVSEQGFSTVTTFETDTGKRAKLVRKLTKAPCKAEEMDAFWKDTGAGGITPKCQEHMTKNFAHLMGADAVAGKTSLLVLLRGPRLGELAVLDAKSLIEKKAIKLQWCEGAGGPGAGGGGSADMQAPDKDAKDMAKEEKTPAKTTSTKRGAVPKPKGGAKDEDPDAGGE